jgi:hypothetical protein
MYIDTYSLLLFWPIEALCTLYTSLTESSLIFLLVPTFFCSYCPALEHLRKKIEISTEKIRLAKVKEEQAKKVGYLYLGFDINDFNYLYYLMQLT